MIYISYTLYYNYINKIYLINNNINMQTYNVEITETLSRMIEVSAETEQQAIEQIEQQYRDCEIILDSNDNIDTNFNIIN